MTDRIQEIRKRIEGSIKAFGEINLLTSEKDSYFLIERVEELKKKIADLEALGCHCGESRRLAMALTEARKVFKERCDEAETKATKFEEALRMISAGQRRDGTWNRDREACKEIAEKAISDLSKPDGGER